MSTDTTTTSQRSATYDSADVMTIVHEEAKAQNYWKVLGIAFLTIDGETGVVRFRHKSGCFGTATFRYYPEVEGGDRALFQHGHYDMDWPTSGKDFAERVRKGY